MLFPLLGLTFPKIFGDYIRYVTLLYFTISFAGWLPPPKKKHTFHPNSIFFDLEGFEVGFVSMGSMSGGASGRREKGRFGVALPGKPTGPPRPRKHPKGQVITVKFIVAPKGSTWTHGIKICLGSLG